MKPHIARALRKNIKLEFAAFLFVHYLEVNHGLRLQNHEYGE